MGPNLQFPADLVTFTEGILNGKHHFLCSVGSSVGGVISQDISKGYCTACSKQDFPALSFTALTLPSFPGYTSVMIPMFHCALFCSSPLITTTSPTLTSYSLLLSCVFLLTTSDIHFSISSKQLPCISGCISGAFVGLYLRYLLDPHSK